MTVSGSKPSPVALNHNHAIVSIENVELNINTNNQKFMNIIHKIIFLKRLIVL